MPRKVDGTWLQVHQELLEREWAADTPAAAIARKLCAIGHTATKNSVLGRIHRLRKKTGGVPMRIKPKMKITPRTLSADDGTALKGCRWGLEPGASEICGKPFHKEGSSYCAEHHAIVWVRPVTVPRPGGGVVFGGQKADR